MISAVTKDVDYCRKWVLSPKMGAIAISIVGSTANNGCYHQYSIVSHMISAATKGIDYRPKWVLSPMTGAIAINEYYF